MEQVNRGVLLGKRSTDWIAGGISGIQYEVRNESGDWTPYLPSTENQSFDGGDSMACVSFSANNCVETQIKFLTGQEINLSDRWLAKLSGTTKQGNYLYVVADTLRKYGAVKEEEWPALPVFNWDDYYAPIPKHIVDKGLQFLSQFDIMYEWVDFSKESLIKHLKHAPLQVVFPNHAVMGFYCDKDILRYFDTYAPYIKERVEPVSSALKIVVSIKKKLMTENEVKALQILEGYQDPDGLKYWVNKPLSEYLKARLADKVKQESEVLSKLNG
jgi:hypothetical protein